MNAFLGENMGVIKYLIGKGMTLVGTQLRSALMFSFDHRNLACLQLLLEGGAPVPVIIVLFVSHDLAFGSVEFLAKFGDSSVPKGIFGSWSKCKFNFQRPSSLDECTQ